MDKKLTCVILCMFCVCATCYALDEQTEIKKIVSLVGQKNLEEASLLTNDLLKEFPKSINAKAVEGWVLGLKGDLAGAENSSKSVFALCPNPNTDDEKKATLMAHETLSGVYVKQGKITEGISESEKALALKPDSEILIWQLAVFYAKSGMYKEAQEKANRLIGIGDKGESKGVMAGYAKDLLQRMEIMKKQQ